MHLERVTAVLRPRGYRDAVDLGFRMARAWWGPIFGSWLALVLPVVALGAATLARNPWVTALLVWWLKPLLDRVSLYILSRGLFGALPGVRETLRALPSLLRRDVLLSLTVLRFDPIRALRLPVWQLEGLHGPARRNRMRVLAKTVHREATQLTFLCLLFELSLTLTAPLLILAMIPQADLESWWVRYVEIGGVELPLSWQWLIVVSYLSAMAVVEPFYIAAGFALYVNRRTHLEAWDIEVVFRKMARRLGTPGARRGESVAIAFILACACIGGGATAEAGAFDEPQATVEQAVTDDPAELVREILASPEFGSERTERVWTMDPGARSVERGPQGASPLGRLLAAALEPVLWVVVVLGLAYLVVQVVVRSGPLTLRGAGGGRETNRPDTVLGLDVRQDSLPDDVAATARQLWTAGDRRGSIRLLYRGAVAGLIARHDVSLKPSSTEGDCVRLAARRIPGESLTYFRSLTESFQAISYGERMPSAELADRLIESWGGHFGARP